jgi:hypothetical protein
MAQEQHGWQLDSLRANSNVSKPDAQQVYEVLLKMLDRWNAHDIEGHLEVYWKSPELLVVVDSEQFNGWQQLRDSYRRIREAEELGALASVSRGSSRS